MKTNKQRAAFLLVCLFLTTSISAIAQNKRSDWTAFNQYIEVDATQELKFKLVATVKADVVRRKGKAGIWTRVDNKNGSVGFFENMRRKPIRLNEDKEYIIEGVIDENSKNLFFGGLAYGNGTFTYQKFELFIENPETGVLERVEIVNDNFESITNSNRPEGWNVTLEDGKDSNNDGFLVSLIKTEKINLNAIQIVGEGR